MQYIEKNSFETQCSHKFEITVATKPLKRLPIDKKIRCQLQLTNFNFYPCPRPKTMESLVNSELTLLHCYKRNILHCRFASTAVLSRARHGSRWPPLESLNLLYDWDFSECHSHLSTVKFQKKSLELFNDHVCITIQWQIDMEWSALVTKNT